MFNVAGKESKPIKSSQIWIDLIKNSIQYEFVSFLKESDMLHSVQVDDFCIGEIPNFLSLLPLAQRASFPVFAIPDKDFVSFDEKTGEYKKMSNTEISNMKTRAENFRRLYKSIAGL